jgi:hypothetical protein
LISQCQSRLASHDGSINGNRHQVNDFDRKARAPDRLACQVNKADGPNGLIVASGNKDARLVIDMPVEKRTFASLPGRLGAEPPLNDIRTHSMLRSVLRMTFMPGRRSAVFFRAYTAEGIRHSVHLAFPGPSS